MISLLAFVYSCAKFFLCCDLYVPVLYCNVDLIPILFLIQYDYPVDAADVHALNFFFFSASCFGCFDSLRQGVRMRKLQCLQTSLGLRSEAKRIDECMWWYKDQVDHKASKLMA